MQTHDLYCTSNQQNTAAYGIVSIEALITMLNANPKHHIIMIKILNNYTLWYQNDKAGIDIIKQVISISPVNSKLKGDDLSTHSHKVIKIVNKHHTQQSYKLVSDYYTW